MLTGDIYINNKSESLAEIKSVPCVKGCAMTYETDGHLMATSEKQFLEGWSPMPITQNLLIQQFKYNPVDGTFYRLRRRDGQRFNRFVNGSKDKDGYILICVNGRKCKAHRLAFIYMTGSAPTEVDHVNHIKSDNRWVNLKASSRDENIKNLPMNKNNTSGFTGVFWHKRDRVWVVRIMWQGKYKYLGSYKDINDAIAVRKDANIKYGYHENHGKKQSEIN